MKLTQNKLSTLFNQWLIAWNNHNLDGVMSLLHDDIVFENWNGEVFQGKGALRKGWIPWFINHGNFKFISEATFFDESTQKMVFMWRIQWPSLLEEYKGKIEVRRGVDILYYADKKIIGKYTYSKTTITIDGNEIFPEHYPTKERGPL